MTTSLLHQQFICMDAETTGLNLSDDRIIEIAAVRFTLAEGIVESFDELIDPKRAIPEESFAIHKISSAMLEGKPTIDVVLPKLLHFIKDDIIIGHQVIFDITMVANAAERLGISTSLLKRPHIDTLRLARSYGDSPNNSLVQLAKHFNISFEDSHRAMSDVLTNIAVFKQLVRPYKTLVELYQLLARPIKMKYMPLGKYKGHLFSDIPHPYLRWALNMDFDQDLLYTIRAELKKRALHQGFSEASNPFKNLG